MGSQMHEPANGTREVAVLSMVPFKYDTPNKTRTMDSPQI